MIYRSLLQLKESQQTVEILLDNGQSSFKGKVLDIDTEYVLMSILYEYDDEEPSWHEAIIKLAFVSSIIYKRELAEFITENKEEYERNLGSQE